MNLYAQAGRLGFPPVRACGVSVAGAARWKAVSRLVEPRVSAQLARALEELEGRGIGHRLKGHTNRCRLVCREERVSLRASRGSVTEPSPQQLLADLRAAFDSSPERLLGCRSAVPLPGQRWLVDQAIARARRQLSLPAFTLFWRDNAEYVPYGTAYHLDDQFAMLLGVNVGPGDLERVALHECQHLADYASGTHYSREELEERADAFSWRAME